MKRGWALDELIVAWTLVEEDWRLLGNKAGATRLGFALVLKYFEIEGEFPRYGEQVPSAAPYRRWPESSIDVTGRGKREWYAAGHHSG